MKRILTFLKWLLLSFGLLLIGALIYVHNLDFSMSDEDIAHAFADLSYHPKEHTLELPKYFLFTDRPALGIIF